MEFRLLGPLTITRDGEPVRLSGRKQHLLLALLACNANEPVAVGRLIEGLWGPQPPRTATENLRIYVYHLRQLMTERERIRWRAPGYVLHMRDGELDIEEFERLAMLGRTALTAEQYEEASSLLRSALSLWRGPAFDGLEDVPTLRNAAIRLNEVRLTALDARLDADLALGMHQELVAELTVLIREHPLRERLRGQLMRALHRSGRRVEALAVYRDARRELVEELGIEPGPELQKIHQAILTEEVEPHHVTAARKAPPRQLARPAPLFVGRAAALGLLDGLVTAPSRTVLVTGMPGVGKTELVLHWSHANTDRFPDGQIFVDLRGFHPASPPLLPEEVLPRILTSLGIKESRVPDAPAEQAALYRAEVTGRRMLIVLDNARSSAQVRPLLPGEASCFTIVTSRLHLDGLVARDAAVPLTLDPMTREAGLDLLMALTGSRRAEATPETLARIVELCDHLPLALRVVGAKLTGPHGVRSIVAQLESAAERLDSLESIEGDLGVRSAFALSFRALPPEARHAFHLLSTHPTKAFTLTTAESLLRTSRPATLRTLSHLTYANLLTTTDDTYAMFPLIRLYASERGSHAPWQSEARRDGALG